jgi:Transcription factor WhiB
MTTATARFHLALITLAQRGERVRCSDPVDHQRWTSDDHRDRQIAMAWCAGCPIIVECGQAADARDERWHVWGGRDYTRKPRAQQAA